MMYYIIDFALCITHSETGRILGEIGKKQSGSYKAARKKSYKSIIADTLNTPSSLRISISPL